MNSKRLYFLLCALIALFSLAIAGSAYEINGLLGQKSQKLVASRARLAALQQEQTELKQAKKDIATYSELYKISRTIVPESKDQAETVRQIVQLANQNGIAIQSITFPASTLGSGVKTTTGTGAGAAPSVGATGGAGALNPALSQLVKLPTIPGVYVLDVQVSNSTTNGQGASYKQLIGFLNALEQNRLTAQVNKLSISPAKSTTSTSSAATSFGFQLGLDIYIKP